MSTKSDYNIFICKSCPDSHEMDYAAILAHLKTVHGIAKGTSGTRTMLSHIDGRDFYVYQFQWDIAGVTLLQETRNARNKNSLMRG